VLESKYQAGVGVIILGQNPQTFMIPIYSTTVLYDIRKALGGLIYYKRIGISSAKRTYAEKFFSQHLSECAGLTIRA